MSANQETPTAFVWMLLVGVFSGLCGCAETSPQRSQRTASPDPTTASAEPPPTPPRSEPAPEPAIPSAAEPGKVRRYELTTLDGHHHLTLQLPDPIPLNQEFGIEGTVTLATGIRVNAAMPQHGHGMVRNPAVTFIAGAHDADRFLAEGMLFHMPGRWEVYFDVEKEFLTERAHLVVEVQ